MDSVWRERCQSLTENFLPRPQTRVLENGLHIHLLPLPGYGVTGVYGMVRTGGVYEEELLGYGVSHFLEHMLFHDSGNYPGNAIAEQTQKAGGDCNAFTSYAMTFFEFELPPEELDRGIEMLSSMLQHGRFLPDKFEKERQVILRERKMYRDQPNSRLTESLLQNAFHVHPIRHPLVGYSDRLEALTLDMLERYYHRRYTPGRTHIIVAGELGELECVFDKLEQCFGGWARGNINEIVLPEEPLAFAPQKHTTFFEDPQSRIGMGFRIPAISHPDFPALTVLSGILGENNSSRLLKHLQRDQELALMIRSGCIASSFPGLFCILGMTRADQNTRLLDALQWELEDLRRGGVTLEEVEREKVQQKSILMREWRSIRHLATGIAGSLSAFGWALPPEMELKRLQEVTPDMVNAAAEKYLSLDTSTTVLQLPPEKKRTVAGNPALTFAKSSHSLPHGLELRLQEGGWLDLCEIQLVLPGGTLSENRENCGISLLTAEMMTAGAGEYDEETLNCRLDDLGCGYEISSGQNSLIMKFNVLSERLPELLHLLECMWLKPQFPEDAFLREQKNLLERQELCAVQPMSRAQTEAAALRYGDHPAGLPADGLPEAVKNLQVDHIAGYYRSLWQKGRVFLGFGGKFDRDLALEFAGKLDADICWQAPQPLPDLALEVSEQEQKKEIVLPREECAVIYALPVCSHFSSDRYALDLLLEAANGLAAELFTRVRGDHSLAYSVGTQMRRGLVPGMIFLYALGAPERQSEILKIFREEVLRWGNQGLGEAEFAAAKRSIKQSMRSMTGRLEQQLTHWLLNAYYKLEDDTPEVLQEKYEHLTREEVNTILQKYFQKPVGVAVTAGGGKDA